MDSAHIQNKPLSLRTVFQYCPKASSDGNPQFSSFPVPSNRYVTRIAAGFGFWLYVDDNGSLYSWGYNGEFQRLGISQPNSFQRDIPHRVPISEEIRVVDCAAGSNHSLFLTDQGHVYAFGSNESNQLGIDDVEDVSGPRPVPLGYKAQNIQCGWDFSIAVLTSGHEIMTWGNSRDGQLGYDSFERTSLPKRIQLPGKVVQISAGHAHVAVILNTLVGNDKVKKVMTWGSDGLAHSSGTSISSVNHLPAEDVAQVSAGKSYTLFRTHHGILYAAGSGEDGQLGLGDYSGRSYAAVVPKLLKHRVIDISTGGHHALAITEEGSIFAWGRIYAGRKRRSSVPVEISTFPDYALRSFPFSKSSLLASNAGTSLFCFPLREDLDPTASVCRPMRQWTRDVFMNDNLSLPDYLKNAHVYYKCEHGIDQESAKIENRCKACSLPYYAPLLVGRSQILKEYLRYNDEVLYFSQDTKNVVLTILALFQSGYINPKTTISTMLHVLPILSDLNVPVLVRLAQEFWERQIDDMQLEDSDSHDEVHTGQKSTDLSSEHTDALSPQTAQKHECSICMNNLTDGMVSIVQLSCSHTFHGTCLATWARRKNNCPICRAPLGNIEINQQLEEPIQHSDLWDRMYSNNIEMSDEMKYRKFLSGLNQQQLPGQITINITLYDNDGVEFHLGRFDAFQLAVHSNTFRKLGLDKLRKCESGKLIWRVSVDSQRGWRDGIVGIITAWFSGGDVNLLEMNTAQQAMYGEVICFAYALGMEQFQRYIETLLIANIRESIPMTIFARLLKISRETGADHLRHKLCAMASDECVQLQLEYATEHAKILAYEAKKRNTSWNVAASAVASKGPGSLRRNRVFCLPSMTDAAICETYEDASWKNCLLQSGMEINKVKKLRLGDAVLRQRRKSFFFIS